MTEYLKKQAVLEWLLAMIDYNDENTEIKAMAMKELVKLAGLEEQKDAPETSD